ncbi:MAG TPA: CxxC-x17-CxxC domain-containing protein [Candidatus Nanoarchaeia archaeon]|nr:CxxC-x17-CxxC domain-containing protein [Candidatus Nanoarchaeia archaeon]
MPREFDMENRGRSNPRDARKSSGRDRDDSRREERRGPRNKDHAFKEFDMNDRRPKLQFYEATCDRCGKQCDLPFKPTGSKPVYCRDCFNKGEEAPSRSSGPASRPGNDQFDQINRKLDKIMKALHLID